VYVTNFGPGGQPSTFPAAPIRVNNNFIIANYHSGWAVDNDDGSAWWNTTNNVQVYGGDSLLKNDFAGHSNYQSGNLGLYLPYGYVLFGDVFASANYTDVFSNNTVVLNGNSIGAVSCTSNDVPYTSLNKYYAGNPSAVSICGQNFTAWQKSGQEAGSVVLPTPANDTTYLTWITQRLGF
jgi:hypothetical protein